MPKTLEQVAKEAENNSYEFHEGECYDDLAHTVSSDREIMRLYEEVTRFLKEGNRPAYRQCMKRIKVVKEETIIQKLQRNVRQRQVELEEAERVLKEVKEARKAGRRN